MDLAISLSIMAGLLQLLAFAIYNKQILQETSQPNTATWTLWFFLTILNASSYLSMSGDWVKCILPFVSSIACVLTFLFSLSKGKFSKLDPWDSIALLIGITAGIVWWYSKSATYANLILQTSIAISFIPTYRGVWKNPLKERALPWYLWSLAYLLLLYVVLLRWSGQYQDLVYPVSGLVFHAMVGVLTNRKGEV